MRIIKAIIVLVLFPVYPALFGQDTVKLAACYEKAIQNYPVARDKQLNEKLAELHLKNIDATWLPQLSLGGQATYQSDVTHVSLSMPGITIPEARKDQYKVTLDINQTLYDGGLAKSQRALESSSQLTESQQVEIELYQLKDRINAVYFSIIMVDSNIKLIQSAKQSVDEKIKSLESAVRNGTMISPDKDVFVAESLKYEEKLFELNEDRATGLKNLAELTGEKYRDSQKFELPALSIPDTTAGSRPESVLYDLQMKKLDASIKVIDSKNLPHMFLFSTVGYGNPALNMLADKFSTYGIVGAGLKWTFWDWNTSRRDKEALLIQKDMLADKKSVFEMNKSISLKSEYSKIQKFQRSLDLNKKLVDLRRNITSSSASKLSAGTIISSDYIADLNAQVQAEINLELSKISLIQSLINYSIIKGEK